MDKHTNYGYLRFALAVVALIVLFNLVLPGILSAIPLPGLPDFPNLPDWARWLRIVVVIAIIALLVVGELARHWDDGPDRES